MIKKINKLSAIIGVGILSAISTFQPLTNAQAALTAPSNYDIAYISNGSNFNLIAPGYTPNSTIPLFTRTSDGAFFNYTHNFSSGQHSNTANFDLPDGLDITMTFNRSNTSWTDASPAGFTGYYATDTIIGSDNTVGTISNKFYFKFDNQTNKNYIIHFDNSSTQSVGNNRIDFNGQYLDVFSRIQTQFQLVYLPSYSYIEIYLTSTSNTRYFDAWYLQDLGVSASYQEGYDIGETEGYADGLGNNPNILLGAVETTFGIIVNFLLFIFTLSVFDISLLSIFVVLISILGVIWILKAIRG